MEENKIEVIPEQAEEVMQEPIVHEPTLDDMEREYQKKRQRRRWRNTIILLIALGVFFFVGTVSGFVFVYKYYAEEYGSQVESSGPPFVVEESKPSEEVRGPGVENGPTIVLQNRPDTDAGILTIPEIFQKVSPSVVMILAGDDAGMALGTGIIMSKDGYIITNAHIIDDAKEIQIVLNDNKTIYDATIMGADTMSDIAVLKVDATHLQPAVFGDSEQVIVGESVVTIGNPYSVDYAQTVTNGIISGIRYNVYDGKTSSNLLQTNAQLNPGNSGGPLINMYGQVIGINSSKIMSSGDSTYEGLGFAIPMTDAKEIVDELIRFGYIVPDPVIGVTVSFVDVDTAMADGAVSGCMVMTIEKNSDAYRKGLRVGDIITEINGKTFEDLDGFIEEKNRFEVGDTVELTYWREGDIKTIRVKLHSAT